MLERIGNKDWNEYRAQVQEYNTTKVVGKGFGDRSYLIRDSEGKVFQRNTSSDQVKDVKPNRYESVPTSNEDSVYDDAVEEQPVGVSEEARTRSGRSVREPAYLRDYVRY